MEATERISGRIAERRKLVASILAKHPDLKWLAEELRKMSPATKFLYLQSEGVTLGKLELGVPVGMTRIEPKKRKKK